MILNYDTEYELIYDRLTEEQAIAYDRAHKDLNEYHIQLSVYPNGTLERIIYYNKEKKRDRTDGPAVIEWFEDGIPASELYLMDGLLHRDPIEGPAETWYHKDGTISFSKNYWHGKEEWAKDKWVGYPPPDPDEYDSNGLGRVFR